MSDYADTAARVPTETPVEHGGRGDSGRPHDSGPGGPAGGAPSRTVQRYAAVAGVLAAAVALGITELAAAFLDGAPSLVLGVGDLVIDSVPGWLERAAIATLGRADKPVLIAGILVVCAVLGALVGRLGIRNFTLAATAFGLAGILGVGAGMADPENAPAQLIAAVVAGVAAGILSLRLLLSTLAGADGPPGASLRAPAVDTAGIDRRGFLQGAVAALAVTVIAAVGSRIAVGRQAIADVRTAVRIPRPARPAPPPPPGADLDISGLSPLYVDNEDFYRIDTALTVPQVNPADWSLRVEGMVERPFTMSYEDLLALDHIEADITLACVSNDVGGDLVGNARWQGVPLYQLLERAGVLDGATQLIGRSVDGFTAGFPTAIALAGREAMVAIAMNGEPLPAEHGFPARLVVPGLYGYVSATKWLSAIELTTFEDVAGYWIPRGWAREGPIKTQSRIDVPASSASVPAGRVPVAGVAWAPTRGIERVEVQIDDGAWVEAELAASLDVDSWRQWVYRWDAEPGSHRITVRATDGTGETQTPERTSVAPDGASGHHSIAVDVQAT